MGIVHNFSGGRVNKDTGALSDLNGTGATTRPQILVLDSIRPPGKESRNEIRELIAKR